MNQEDFAGGYDAPYPRVFHYLLRRPPRAQPHAAAEHDPEELALGRLDSEMIWKCMDALSPEHRKVLLLRIVAGLSAREVGELIGRTEGTVRSLQLRALLALRALSREAEVRAKRRNAAR